MAEITAASVMALREQTQQGMMECKRALQEANGDAEVAKEILRKKGLVKIGAKADRATKEGVIVVKISPDNTAATMIAVACETDFCSRNAEFRSMSQKVLDLAAAA
ncbi:MAG: translation elongation factor Ts, partial [Planctomycetota bacterium]